MTERDIGIMINAAVHQRSVKFYVADLLHILRAVFYDLWISLLASIEGTIHEPHECC